MAQMQNGADKAMAAVSVVRTAARPVAIVGKKLEYEIEQLHRFCDFRFGHRFACLRSGCKLTVSRAVGEGTTVKLYLPRNFGEETAQPGRVAALAVTGTEKLLVVDDDEIVRTTVASMLEDLGYTVVVASSGREALAVLEKCGNVDLLFTDVVMPGAISGRRLAERAVEIAPKLRVLFTSGYTENAIVHNGRLDAGVELLSKPYGREQLAAKVRRVLDGVPGEPRKTADI